jgi:hypothetical protein
LAFLEQQAGGARAGEHGAPQTRDSGQASLMGYFAAAAMRSTSKDHRAVPEHVESVLDRLNATQVDELSPREALDVLYALKNDMEGAR